MAWLSDSAEAAPATPEPEQKPDTSEGWASEAQAAEPAQWASETKPAQPADQPEDPGLLGSLLHGIQAGIGETKESAQAIEGEQPTPPAAKLTQGPEAQPLTWSDALHPFGSGGEKVLYQLGAGAPSLGAGVAGGVAGGLVGGAPGSLAGGALGAAAGAAFQEVGPYFERALRTGLDPEAAWSRALEEAGTAGAFSGAGWYLFPTKFFSGPLKNLAFQAFGIQPGLQAAGQAAQNIEEGRPVSENLGQAYGTGVATTAVPMLGHAALRGFSEGDIAPSQINPNQMPIEPGKSLPGAVEFSPMPAPPDPLRWSPDTFSGRTLNSIADSFKKTFLPESQSEVSRGAAPIVRQFISESASGRDAAYRLMNEAHSSFAGMSPDDSIEFMKYAAGEPTNDPAYQPPPEFNRFMPEVNNLMRQVLKDDQDHNILRGLTDNDEYFPRQFKNPEQANAFFQQLRTSLGTGGFQKKRTLELLQDGLNNGLELVSTNPADLIMNRLIGSSDMQARMRLMYRMNQAGYATPVNNIDTEILARRNGWNLVKDPSGQQWAMHPDLKPMWDNVITNKGLWASQNLGGDMFRGWMKMKNFYVPIKLALSLFHPLHVAHINLNDSLVRGWNQLTRDRNPLGAAGTVMKGLARSVPFSDKFGTMRQAERAREAWLTPEWEKTPEQKEVTRYMTEGGFSPQLSEELRNSFKRGFSDALAQRNPLGMVGYGVRDAINHMQSALFEKWIPSLKTASYLDEVRTLLQRRPELITDDTNRRLALSTIAKSVDNRYGEMFYKNLFWNRALKDAGIGSFLSLGWNLGFAREFGGGLLEPLLSKLQTGTPTRDVINQVKSKSAFALSYMATAMLINSIISKQFGGVNYQDMEPMDYILPRISGNNPDGSPRRVSNMFYTRELPMLSKHIEDAGGNWIAGAKEMLWNKMMLEPFNELLNNRDYYGYNIWNESAPYYQQAYQIAKYVLSDQFNPITYAGAKRALEASGKLGPNDNFASTAWKIISNPEGQAALAGFGPAPTYASRSETVNRINYLFQRYVAPTEKPQMDQEMMEKRRLARNQLEIAKQKGDSDGVAAAQEQLRILGVGKKANQKMTADTYMFSRLPLSIKRDLLLGYNKQNFIKYFSANSGPARNQLMADPQIRALMQHYYSQ